MMLGERSRELFVTTMFAHFNKWIQKRGAPHVRVMAAISVGKSSRFHVIFQGVPSSFRLAVRTLFSLVVSIRYNVSINGKICSVNQEWRRFQGSPDGHFLLYFSRA